MVNKAALLALVSSVGAAPTTIKASDFAGSATKNVYPPSGSMLYSWAWKTPHG